MRMPAALRLQSLAVASLLWLMLAGPRPAWACTCRGVGSPSEVFSCTDAVFVGTAKSVVRAGELARFFERLRQWAGLPPSQNLPYGRFVTLAVDDSWKAVNTPTVVLRTGYGTGDCGYDFIIGRQYVVYAYAVGGAYLVTNNCTRTAAVAAAPEDLRYLHSQPKLALAATATVSRPLACGAAALGSGLLLSAAILRHRRHKRAESGTRPAQ